MLVSGERAVNRSDRGAHAARRGNFPRRTGYAVGVFGNVTFAGQVPDRIAARWCALSVSGIPNARQTSACRASPWRWMNCSRDSGLKCETSREESQSPVPTST